MGGWWERAMWRVRVGLYICLAPRGARGAVALSEPESVPARGVGRLEVGRACLLGLDCVLHEG